MKKGVMMMVAMVVVISGLMATPEKGQMMVEKMQVLSKADLFELGVYTPPKVQPSPCQPGIDEVKLQALAKDIQKAFFFEQKESERIARKWLLNGYGKPTSGRARRFDPEDWDLGGWRNGVTSGNIIAVDETGSEGILSGSSDWECISMNCVGPPPFGIALCPACPAPPPPWCCAEGDPPGCKTQYWVWWRVDVTWAYGACWCDKPPYLCNCSYGDVITTWTPVQGQAQVCAE